MKKFIFPLFLTFIFFLIVFVLSREPNEEVFLKGAILPHHSLVSGEIEKYFNTIEDYSFERVIIVGPNHKDVGADILANKKVDFFPKAQKAESVIMESEQSVTTLIPFVNKYYPKAEVTSFILKSTVSFEDSKALGKALRESVDSSILIIASVDFSHYLPSLEAEERDRFSKRLILGKNAKDFFGLGSDYLDSPQALAVIFEVFKGGDYQPQVLFHSNSGELMGDAAIPTTSYFVVDF